VIAKVHDDGRVKISMRSRGATDVGALAAELGGGGHRLAAGFTYNGDVSGALNEIRTRIGRYR
jgi:phosphoesterase RecJ-like protein